MQAVMKQHFRVATRHNVLFQPLCIGLEAEARAAAAVRSPSDTEAGADEVSKWLREVKNLTRQNRFTKTKTWFEPLVAIAQGIKVHTAYLYVLCILCKEQGHFKKFEDIPVHGGAREPVIISIHRIRSHLAQATSAQAV